MNKLKVIILFYTLNITCLCRNPFSYGIKDNFEYIGSGTLSKITFILIKINNQLFKIQEADSYVDKYKIEELNKRYILLRDDLDNKIKINLKISK